MHSTKQGGDPLSAARAAVIVGGIDLVVTLGALLAARSSVILADFCKTLLEFIAVLLAWLTIRKVRQGASEQFQYGVGKLENLSSLLVGILMFLCLAIIIANSVYSLLHPAHIGGIGVLISAVAQVAYAFINLRLVLQCRRLSKEQNSPLFAAQAGLFTTKFIGNVFILAALGLSTLLSSYSWSTYIDPCASLVIASSILFAALGIFKDSTLDLLDRTLEEKHQIAILRALATHFDRYEEFLEVRSRRSGSQVFVEIVLSFPAEQLAKDTAQTARELKADLEREIPGSRVTIAIA